MQCVLFLYFLAITASADSYFPNFGTTLDWFSIPQYSVANSYVACYQSSSTPDFSQRYCVTSGNFSIAIDPVNKRAAFGGYQWITDSGTYFVINSWDNATQSLSGPKACYFNADATYDQEAANYAKVIKDWDESNQNNFNGLISHGGVCGSSKSSFLITVNNRQYVSAMYVVTPFPRGKGTPDKDQQGLYWFGFPQVTQTTAPEYVYEIPDLCSTTTPYCTAFDT